MPAEVERVVTVQNPLGIHMRPADVLSREAQKFSSQIVIEKDGQLVDCKSILSILTLGARQGAQLNLKATGEDAVTAVDVLTELFASGFDETDSEVVSQEP